MIATILMVAITVVLAAVLYVMVVNLIGDGGDGREPKVVVEALSCEAGSCEGRVTTSQPTQELARFNVAVFAGDATAIPATTLVAGTNLTGGGVTFSYRDVGGEGKMTAGDTFRLSGIAAGVTYEVVFLWKDSDNTVSSLEMAS